MPNLRSLSAAFGNVAFSTSTPLFLPAAYSISGRTQRIIAKGCSPKRFLYSAENQPNWLKPHFQGVAVDHIKNTVCSQVAEISIEQNRIRVHKIVCAVDCGQIINPDIVKTQIESCIAFCLTAGLSVNMPVFQFLSYFPDSSRNTVSTIISALMRPLPHNGSYSAVGFIA